MPKARCEMPVRAALLAIVLGMTAGCGTSPTSYLHPNIDFGYMERAAVLPFRNLSQDGLAGERLQSIFLMELLEEDALAIVDPRETSAAVRDLGLSPGADLTPEQAVALGTSLRVDALFFGVVEEYSPGLGDRTRGPQITAVLGMIETQTGAVVWRAQVHETGASIWKRLFGGRPDDVYTVSRDAVRRALRTLL
jgi:hypothetical protein